MGGLARPPFLLSMREFWVVLLVWWRFWPSCRCRRSGCCAWPVVILPYARDQRRGDLTFTPFNSVGGHRIEAPRSSPTARGAATIGGRSRIRATFAHDRFRPSSPAAALPDILTRRPESPSAGVFLSPQRRAQG